MSGPRRYVQHDMGVRLETEEEWLERDMQEERMEMESIQAQRFCEPTPEQIQAGLIARFEAGETRLRDIIERYAASGNSDAVRALGGES